MDSQFAANNLARLLKQGRLVTLVGSGASADYVDERGRAYRGLPTPDQFVRLARQPRDYLDDDMSFEDACGSIVMHEGRITLEQLLKQQYEVSHRSEVPPAHRILAWLPFAAYFTSNYDQLLEWALESEDELPAVVIDNGDLARLARDAVPVIKYHGCVSRPMTMVATPSDYAEFADRTNLVRDLMKVTLASSNLLVIGHGLRDSDLSSIIDDLLTGLGKDYIPTIYVVREPEREGSDLDVTYNYVDVFEDLTVFLSRLLNIYRSLDRADVPYAVTMEEDWLKSAFFTSIRRISVLPTETQVIDAFLDHLADELSARTDVGGVVDDANSAVLQALDERPNYEALANAWSILSPSLSAVDDPIEAETIVREEIDRRIAKEPLFAQIGKDELTRNQRVLLYSQSKRVLQVLRGVPYAFVNTAGSLAVAIAAERYNVEVLVIAEIAKLKEVHPTATSDEVRPSFEENLLTAATGIADLKTLRRPVEHLNVGYDPGSLYGALPDMSRRELIQALFHRLYAEITDTDALTSNQRTAGNDALHDLSTRMGDSGISAEPEITKIPGIPAEDLDVENESLRSQVNGSNKTNLVAPTRIELVTSSL
jgi:hypothetical protein